MATMFKCDICGAPFELMENVPNGLRITAKNIGGGDRKAAGAGYYDICPKCYSEIDKVIKERRSQNE